jgi:pimeloyl-ACP methyl ester carboxylesterase
VKVYFFPGLAADGSLVRFPRLQGANVEWIHWPRGLPSRWADFERKILSENAFEPGSVFVGISFGGMAAQRIARFANPRGIILIGSMTRPRSISLVLRAVGACVRFTPSFCFNAAFVPWRIAAWLFGVPGKKEVQALLAMSRKFPPADVKALCLLALSFPPTDAGCPIRSIHGGKDRMVRADVEKRDRILPKGGHLIALTHVGDVEAALLRWIHDFETPSLTPPAAISFPPPS